jgi:hypothetical protein
MRIDDLEKLFAKAGKAEAARCAATQRQRAERARLIERCRLRQLGADARAPQAAERVWRWLSGADAERLREMLRTSGLTEVLLIPWMTDDGKVLDGAAIGAWSISLSAKRAALWVRRIAYPPGGRWRLVHSPAGLLRTAPSRVVVALDRALGSGRYLRAVRISLRERTRADA